MTRYRDRAGITLTDVVIVLALIGIGLTLALPALQTTREDERRITCVVRMKNLATSLHLYHDNFGRFPPSAFYGDGENLGDKHIALKKVVPGQGGKKPTHAPYGFLVKLLPYVEQAQLFDQIDFKSREAFDKGNETLAANVVKVFTCPSFQPDQHSAAKDYEKFAGDGPKPALSQYKALGATTLEVLQDAEAAVSAKGDGGMVIPYAAYSFQTLRAPNQTVLFCETREDRYAAWWDGTTASIPGFTDKGTKATRPGLAMADSKEPFLPRKSFGGTEVMQWGPSSEHPGKVNHAFGGTEVMSLNVDIDPKVYAAMITRRTDDNGAISDFLKPKPDGGQAKPAPDPLPMGKNLALGAIHFQMVKERPATNIPAEAVDPLLSWRVVILPYLDQKELYQNIRPNEAWNSEHNKEYHGSMPELYRTRGAVEPNTTTWRMLPHNKAGMMLIDAGKGAAVQWMEPDELKIDAKNPLASLGEAPADGYVVAYQDGRVARVRPADLAAALRGIEMAGAAAIAEPVAEKPAAPQPRMWRDSKGRQLEAMLVEAKDGKVTLRRKDNGKEVSLPVEKLSQADQEFLSRTSGAAVKAPEKKGTVVKPAETQKSAVQAEGSSATSSEPSLKIDFAQVPADYAGREKFLAQHQGQWIELRGIVGNMAIAGTRNEPIPFVALAAIKDNNQAPWPANMDLSRILECRVEGWEPWKHCNKGSEITVRGKPNPGGWLEQCALVESQGQPVPTFKAKELLDAYRKSAAETERKLGNRCVIVSGRVGGVAGANKKPDEAAMFLNADDQSAIDVNYDFADHFSDLKVGDDVTILSPTWGFLGPQHKRPLVLGGCSRIMTK